VLKDDKRPLVYFSAWTCFGASIAFVVLFGFWRVHDVMARIRVASTAYRCTSVRDRADVGWLTVSAYNGLRQFPAVGVPADAQFVRVQVEWTRARVCVLYISRAASSCVCGRARMQRRVYGCAHH